jgi:hypothetical protein
LTGEPGSTNGGFEIRQLRPTHEALGLLVAFLSATAPFSEFRSRVLVRALQQQLERRHHVCLMRGGRFAGYCGWLLTSREIGDRWLNDEAELSPVADGVADVVACTIVHCPDRRDVLPLIREARARNPGRLAVFKRDRSTGDRKAAVRNMSFAAPAREVPDPADPR